MKLFTNATPMQEKGVSLLSSVRKARNRWRQRELRGIYDARRPKRRETRRVAGNELREMIDCISSLHLHGGSHVAPPLPYPNPVVFQPTATRCYYSRCCLISGFVTDCIAASHRQTRVSLVHFLYPPFENRQCRWHIT